MKKIAAFLFLLAIVGAANAIAVPERAGAACANTSTLGAASYEFPTYSDDAGTALWVLSQSSNSQYRFLVEVNDSECKQIDVVASDVGTWEWQKVDGIEDYINNNSAGSNKIKIIGIESGVRIDKVLLVNDNCEPIGDGGNCQSIKPNQQLGAEYTVLTSLPGEVSKKVRLSDTPYNLGDNLSELSYIYDGKIVQQSNKAEDFDTTLLANGQRTIYIGVRTKSSSPDLVKEQITININNSENILSPTIRWFRLNSGLAITVGIVVLAVLFILLSIVFARKYYVSRNKSSSQKLDL